MFVMTMFAIKSRSVFSGDLLRRVLLGAIVLVTTFVVLEKPVAAQRYKVLRPQVEAKAARKLKSQASAAMRNNAAFQANGKEAIDSYYKSFYFPTMTQTNPSALAVLGKSREDLVKAIRGSSVPAAQAHLTNLTLSAMRVLSRDIYHPSVRYNAVLVLGMLDQQYAGKGSGASPPKVLSAGTNELLELLEQSEFKGVKVHPSVKVGALEGLERHVRFGLDAQYTDRVTKTALGVLSQEPAAMDVDVNVNNWIKCQAARILARQFKTGPSKEVQAGLTKLLASSEMDIDDRCCIAGLLDLMTYSAASNASSGLVPLGKLTQAVVAEGAEKAREFEELILGGGRGGGGYSRGRRGEEGPKLERRQLLARLTLIDKGAKSLSEGLSDEEKQKVLGLTDLLSPVMKISKSAKALDLDVAGDVIKLESTINNIVASWQPAAAAVEAAEAGFVE